MNENQTNISITVPKAYPFRGAEFKREIDAFFTYIMTEANDVAMNYSKIEKIGEMLTEW